MNNTKYYWLRWIGVLPVSILAYLIAYNLLDLLSVFNKYMYGMTDKGWYTIYIVPIIASGIAGYAFVIWGALVAPFHKKHVGVILLILLTLLIGASLFIEIGNTSAIEVIKLVADLTGALIGYFAIEDVK